MRLIFLEKIGSNASLPSFSDAFFIFLIRNFLKLALNFHLNFSQVFFFFFFLENFKVVYPTLSMRKSFVETKYDALSIKHVYIFSAALLFLTPYPFLLPENTRQSQKA